MEVGEEKDKEQEIWKMKADKERNWLSRRREKKKLKSKEMGS